MSRWWQGTKGEGYVIIQFFIFALLGFGPRSSPLTPFWSASVKAYTNPFGTAILVFGILLIIAGVFKLGSNLSVLPHPKAGAQLIQTGVYALVRHPIYSGLFIAALGWALFIASPLMVIYSLMLLIFFELKSRREEKQLALIFPDYPAYQERVKKLIPFVY